MEGNIFYCKFCFIFNLALIFVRSIPFYFENETYSLKLPNAFNISINFGIALGLSTISLFPYGNL